MPIALALQGGAGTIVKREMSAEKEAQYKAALQEALQVGYQVLLQNGTALDAVETTVKMLEDCPLFNAGRGSVFTAEGTHEMDASIMDGRHLAAGAVSLIQGIKNPIALARLVMEKSGHVFLAGKGAMEFAKKMQCEVADDAYFYDPFRYEQWQSIKDSDHFQLDHSAGKNDQDEASPNSRIGTVGAVACDYMGNLAAATSTGGMTNKRWGRIGDSPVIGAGVYANNLTCAVSCTGSGEYFLRSVVAYDVSCLIEYKNYTLAQACEEVIHHRLLKIGGDGGLVAVSPKGEVCMLFNTEGMYRASKTPEAATIAIYNL